jgi:hypothetical protein
MWRNLSPNSRRICLKPTVILYHYWNTFRRNPCIIHDSTIPLNTICHCFHDTSSEVSESLLILGHERADHVATVHTGSGDLNFEENFADQAIMTRVGREATNVDVTSPLKGCIASQWHEVSILYGVRKEWDVESL